MLTTLAIMLWVLISVYALVNTSALMTLGKMRILNKCVKEWKRRGEYEKDEEFDMMFFSLPTTVVLGVLCTVPVFHLLLVIPFIGERKELIQKFIARMDKVPIEWRDS